MNDSEKDLIKQFMNISNKRWIKSIDNSTGSVGLTFEKELGKKADDMYFPDYNGIEIKCTSRYSDYPISLFSIAFDGPTFPEINRIVSKYGYPDKKYPDKNILFVDFFFNTRTLVNHRYRFQLKTDSEKIYLYIYDLDNNLIDDQAFIYLKSIKDHLCLKLNEMACVYASTKKIDDLKYHRYYKINLYKLISYEKFIELLINDDLSISLESRVGKSGENQGKYKNKNIVFRIDKKKLNKLFELVYTYNHDEIY